MKDLKDYISDIIAIKPELLIEFIKICIDSIESTDSELTFFREYFQELTSYLNGLHSRIYFSSRFKEIHAKPKINFYAGCCELGDFFVIVKYYHNDKLLKRKLVIYQFKYSKENSNFKIDQKQQQLLSEWPEFSFGKKDFGTNTFNLHNNSNDLGSYCFVNKNVKNISVCQSVFLDGRKSIGHKELCGIFPYFLPNSIFLQIIDKYGEDVYEKTPLSDFVDTLYRYMEWEKDPPNEFGEYMTTEEGESFFGVEIVVSAQG